MLSYKEVLDHFPGKKIRAGNNAVNATCPCHADRKQSLTITDAGERILLHCQAGCKTEEILQAVSLTWSDIGPSKEKRTSYNWRERMEYGQAQIHGEGTHIQAVYDYKDEEGRYLFSKIRIEGGDIDGKTFLLARVDYRADTYEKNLGGVKATLYNLPDLLRSIREGYPVYIVEGEKDVETMRKVLHYTATTAGGVGGWKKEYARFFRGATVTILPDNDAPGEKLAKEIYKDLAEYAFKTRIIPKISNLQKGDITDFFEKEGRTPDEFKEIIHAAGNEFFLASWAFLNRYGEVNIKPSALAVSFSKITDYIIVRNPIDDNDLYYGYRNGVYSRCNKAQVKAALREMVPVSYQKDNQITEAYRTIFELGTKIHSFEDLNKDERYINFRNGLYDVRRRELLPHSPKILSTVQLGYSFDPKARDAPVFSRYIRDLFTKEDGTFDQDSMKILQEFSGLAISNIYVYRSKKALFLCSFRGNTGKTVFMNLLQLILGEDNVTSIPIQHMNEGTGRFTMGTAIGKRMIINGDQTESDIGDSSYFKQLTGGDRTKMENKNQKPLMVRYRGGIMIGCNGLPSFTDDKGEHIFERLLLIMCTNVIDEAKRDPELLDKMKPEIPAIINWMLEGLNRLLLNNFKFTRSAASEMATKDYRSQLDTVYRFIQEGEINAISSHTPYHWKYVLTKDHRDQVSKKDFYDSYQAWCEDPDIDVMPVKKKNLAQRLEALGCEVDRRGTLGDRRGVYTIRGMKYVNSVTENSRIPTDEELKEYVRKKSAKESVKSPQEQFEPQTDPTPFDKVRSF